MDRDDARREEFEVGEQVTDRGGGPGLRGPVQGLVVCLDHRGRARRPVARQSGERQEAAGRPRPEQAPHDLLRLLLVGHDVQHAEEQDGDGLVEVENRASRDVGHEFRRTAQVAPAAIDDAGAVAPQQSLSVGDHGRIVVHVHHA
jgi:hypothetical protein